MKVGQHAPEMVYVNFDLETEKADGGYRTHVLSSPAGEARAAMGPLAVPAADATPQVVGGALFDAVFRDEVLSCLRRSLDAAQHARKGLRIRLRLAETPELAGLPWELLYDGESATFLALSRETPLVRYLDLPEAADDIKPQMMLRVLAVIAGPKDQAQIDVEHEWQTLKAGLADLERRGAVALDRLEPPTLDALREKLSKEEYHILHFYGHGEYVADSNDGVLLLTNNDGTSDAVTGETFSMLLRDQKSLRLALISACRGAVSGDKDPYSGVAQRLVRGGVDAVIAMRSTISDPAAVALARSFYTTLASGAAVDEALAEARKTLYSGGFPNDWATAVLYMRAADGHLWRKDPKIERERLYRKLAVAGSAVALVLLATFAWWYTRPTHMPDANTMNIAVLDPGETQANGSVIRTSKDDAESIRKWMVAALTTANGPDAAAQHIGLWSDDLSFPQKRDQLPILQAAKDDALEAEAAKVSSAISATVLITGRIRRVDGKRELVPEFYFVSPRFASEAEEAIGYFTLGGPIPLADSLSADKDNAAYVAGQLKQRVGVLETALLALREDLFGNHAGALKLLEAKATQLGVAIDPAEVEDPGQPPAGDPAQIGSGLDVLYYFLGRESLFLDQNQAAVVYAQKAIAINPDNVRAYIVEAGGLLSRSWNDVSTAEVALQPQGLWERARDAYREAADRAGKRVSSAGGQAPPILAKAGLGMADALVTRGEMLVRDHESAETLQQADARLQEGLDALGLNDERPNPLLPAELRSSGQFRMLAQYYAAAGRAYLAQSYIAVDGQNPARAMDRLAKARDSYQKCVAQRDESREDLTLRTRIAAACEEGLKVVENMSSK